MNYENAWQWAEYTELMKSRPEEFTQSENLQIITDINTVAEFVKKTGRQIGVMYQSKYSILVVDLVKDKNGKYYAFERTLPLVKNGAVVTVPQYGDQFVLLKQYRHSLRDYQYAFPRGFGEIGISPENNAKKEISEEIGAVVLEHEHLGNVVADSGRCGDLVSVYYCRVTKPICKKDYEGIEEMLLLREQELDRLISDGMITDGFTLSAWSLLKSSLN